MELALFAVGWDLLVRDVRVALRPDSLHAVEAVLATHGVREAMACRDNLVNYKKVLLGIYQSSVTLTHDLRRLATFFREPPADYKQRNARDGGKGYLRPEPYCSLSDSLGVTEGAVAAILDGRRFAKAVCCVPRHPEARAAASWTSKDDAQPEHGQPFNHYRCAGLLAEDLPEAFKSWRLLKEARDGVGGAAGSAELRGRLDARMERAAAAVRALPAQAESGWSRLLDDLAALKLPPPEGWAVRCVLIARGGAKALAVAAEARRLAAVMREVLQASRECEAIVEEAAEAAKKETDEARRRHQAASDESPPSAANGEEAPARAGVVAASDPAAAPTAPNTAAAALDLPSDASAEGGGGGGGGGGFVRQGHPSVRARVLARKHACALGGATRALELVVHWLGVVAEDNAEGRVLFVGADADDARVGCVHFAPKGFEALGRIFGPPRSLAETHTSTMMERLGTHGWPNWILTSAKRAAQPCVHCGTRHAPTWMRDGACLECETRVRAEGRCPYAKGCGPATWCPHAKRCLLCDRWSCAACRFHQGDGSDVAALVASARPSHLYVDFDRTLCSTKGGSPLKGHHSIDEELVGVCSQLGPGRAHVVTRNSHVDEIRKFLDARGLAHVPVHRVPRPRSKAEVVGAHANKDGRSEEEQVVLFVDDTIAEHLDDEMQQAKGVVRFLFARASGARSGAGEV